MATHQEIAGLSDEDLVARMVERYDARFDEEYWGFFKANVGRHLAARPRIVDLGSGPGLYLRDLSERHRDAALYGFDITPAMIEHASGLRYAGAVPTLALHDVARAPLPLDAGAVDLVSMTALLHLLDDPFPVLAEVRRVLRAGGLFLLDDWIRKPLSEYLRSRGEPGGEESERDRHQWMSLFPFHNKYTVGDWQWLLTEAGFSLVTTVQLRPHSKIFVCMPRHS